MTKNFKKTLKDDEIIAIVQEDKTLALNYYNGVLKPKFEKYYELYNGETMNAAKYRMPEGSFISRDVMVTVRTLLPDITRLLFTGEPVDISARSSEDEETAGKMQSLVNYQITQQNPFHLIFNRVVTGALITGCCALKAVWEKKVENRIVREAMPLFAAELLKKRGCRISWEIIPDEYDVLTGDVLCMASYEKQVVTKNQPVFEVMPHEEFLFDPNAASVDEARFIIHRKLVNFDYLKRKEREGVYKNIEDIKETTETYDEDGLKGGVSPYSRVERHKPRKTVMLNEYWGKIDINGDGFLEDIVITYCGGRILSVEENTFGMYPFFVFTPFFSMNSIAGSGLAELAENSQIIKTALVREMLENTRRNNNRKIFYKPDDLLNPSQMVTNEQYVAVRDGADINNIFAPEPFESLSQNSFSLVEYFDKECRKVTGVSEMKQGIINAQEQTATEAAIKYEAANAQAQAIALNLAESLKNTYRFIVYQNQRFIDERQVIRLLNEVIEVNPEDIRDVDFDLKVSASFGNGTAETRRRALNSALTMMLEVGEPRLLTDRVKIRNLIAKILEESGLKDTDNYLISESRLLEENING